MKANKFNYILNTLLCLTILFCCYIAVFFFQINSPGNNNGIWIKNVLQYKHYLSEKIHQKKIMLVCGSNGLFGINSQLLQEKMSLPVANLSVNADLDLSFYFYQIKRHMNEGDIVIMPLEFEYYSRKELSIGFIDQMISWGADDYIFDLPTLDLLNFIIETPPKRVLLGTVQILSNRDYQNPEHPDALIEQLDNSWKNAIPHWQGYSHLSLTPQGDIAVAPKDVKQNTYIELNYIKNGTLPSKEFLKKYFAIKQLVDQRKGQLILTYPVTARSSEFDFQQIELQSAIEEHQSNLKKHGIHIECNPALFNIENSFFFDTIYHPNSDGANIRTEALIHCLKGLIQDSPSHPVTYKDAYSLVRSLESKYKTKP